MAARESLPGQPLFYSISDGSEIESGTELDDPRSVIDLRNPSEVITVYVQPRRCISGAGTEKRYLRV